MNSFRSLFFLLTGAIFMGASVLAHAQSTDTEEAPTAEVTSEESENQEKGEQVEGEHQEGGDDDMEQGTQDSAQMDSEEASDPTTILMDQLSSDEHKLVFAAFMERFPGVPVEAFSEAPYEGLFEVITEGRIIYVNAAMTMLFQGDITDLTTGTNVTEARLSGIHMGLINDMGEENMLVYTAEEDTGRSITIFTDINCGYCRKLHSEIDTLLNAGINVRYLMFPRAGLDTDSSMALESVWCDDNPQEAMTSAKAGQPIQQNECDTPIEQHYALAGQVGLRGTPLIYLDDGTAIPGYREANVIVQMINSSEPLAQ